MNRRHTFHDIVLPASDTVHYSLLVEVVWQDLGCALDQQQHLIDSGFLWSDPTTTPFSGQPNFHGQMKIDIPTRWGAKMTASASHYLLRQRLRVYSHPRMPTVKTRQGCCCKYLRYQVSE